MLPRLSRAAFSSSAAQHRPFLKRDAERLRLVTGGGFVLGAQNPGVRLEPDFLDESEAAELVQDARAAAEEYGYPYDGDRQAHALAQDGSIVSTAELINNVRVTGRLEKAGVQRLPAWGYGETFDEGALPRAILATVDKVRGSGMFALGPLRDVTINQRSHAYFQLDPHLDPMDDGPDVFILSLLSSAVATFTPCDELLASAGHERRRDPVQIGLQSWSDFDVDALMQPGTLLHFSGPARTSWMHAIRAGVQVQLPTGPAICDWWGRPDYLLRRNDERISVVLAFGERV